jgi:hypothetical protein
MLLPPMVLLLLRPCSCAPALPPPCSGPTYSTSPLCLLDTPPSLTAFLLSTLYGHSRFSKSLLQVLQNRYQKPPRSGAFDNLKRAANRSSASQCCMQVVRTLILRERILELGDISFCTSVFPGWCFDWFSSKDDGLVSHVDTQICRPVYQSGSKSSTSSSLATR